MANTKSSTKKTSSQKTSSRKTTSTKRNASRTTNTAKKATSTRTQERIPVQEPPMSSRTNNSPSLLVRFLCSPIAKPVLLILLILVVLGIDLLAAWNDYTRFFLILGFELLIAGIAWVLRIAITTFNANNNSN